MHPHFKNNYQIQFYSPQLPLLNPSFNITRKSWLYKWARTDWWKRKQISEGFKRLVRDHAATSLKSAAGQVKVKMSLCLTKHNVMKEYVLLN